MILKILTLQHMTITWISMKTTSSNNNNMTNFSYNFVFISTSLLQACNDNNQDFD